MDTLSNCLAGAGVSLMLSADEADIVIGHIRKCSKALSQTQSSQNISDEQAANEILKCVVPLAVLVGLQDKTFFSVHSTAIRKMFWCNALKVALGRRSKLAVMYLSWCKNEAVLTNTDRQLVQVVNSSFSSSSLGDKRAFDVCTSADCIERASKRSRKELSHSLSGGAFNKLVDDWKGSRIKCRHSREKHELARTCRIQAAAFEVRNRMEFLQMACWFVGYPELEYHNPAWTFNGLTSYFFSQRLLSQRIKSSCARDGMLREHAEKCSLLNYKLLSELHAPFLRIRGSQLASVNGCYQLRHSTDETPVYRQYGNNRWLYISQKQQWCISDEQDLSERLPNGWAHSITAHSPCPLQAEGWKVYQGDEWHPDSLTIEKLPEDGKMEFIIISLVGEELLRTTCLPSATISELKDKIKHRKPGKRVRLSLRNCMLPDSKALGSLSITPDEALQAVFQEHKYICQSCKSQPMSQRNSESRKCVDCERLICIHGIVPCQNCGSDLCTTCIDDVAYCLKCLS